jgi:hypothetical protein
MAGFSWEGRPPRRPTNISGPRNNEKSGTARRPSLPKMKNEHGNFDRDLEGYAPS